MGVATSAAIGLVGAGVSVGQAIQQNKLMKDASKARTAAAQSIKSIREQNPYAGVQVPTLGTKMAMEEVGQQAADTLGALQGVGAAGVIGGAAGLNKSVRDANLDITADLSNREFDRDMAQANAQGGINARQANRDYMTGMAELEGAQAAYSDAQANKNSALGSAFGSLSGAIGEFARTDKFDYVGIIDRIRKKKANNETLTQEEQDLLDGADDQNQA